MPHALPTLLYLLGKLAIIIQVGRGMSAEESDHVVDGRRDLVGTACTELPV